MPFLTLQYYGLPWLSYRNAVWIDAEYSSPWMPEGWPLLTNDGVHPNDVGHRQEAGALLHSRMEGRGLVCSSAVMHCRTGCCMGVRDLSSHAHGHS